MAASGGREEVDAIVWRSPFSTGYPLEIFPSGCDDKFKCVLCKLILRKPLQGFCGHRFCRQCVQSVKSRNEQTGKEKKCPGCIEEKVNEEEEDIKIKPDTMFPDNAVKREMSSVSVRCCNDGCIWAGKFKQYPTHHSECLHQEVKCECRKLIAKVNLQEHLEKECSRRTVACKRCGQQVVFLHTKDHEQTCLKFLVKCSSCGKKNIPRDKLEDHITRECSTPRLRCPAGCEELVVRSKLDQHLKTNLSSHLIANKEKLDSVERIIQERLQGSGSLESFLSATQSKIEDLAHKLNQVSGNAGAAGSDSSVVSTFEMIIRMKTYEDIMKVLQLENRKLASSLEALDQLRKTDKQIQERQEDKIRTLERVLALKDVSIAEMDLRLTSMELVSYDGILVWKIPDFARKRQEAITGKMTSLYSPVFFTNRIGYKMCARLYPNGDGMGKGSHLSLFFVLMRGHYDALLKFPFKEKVTLMLLDQSGRETAEHVVDSFRPDPASSSFKNPTSEMNIASGCPLFMPLHQLQNVSAKYVLDDTIFIKIIVECKDN